MATNEPTRDGADPTAFGPADEHLRHGASHHAHRHDAAATPSAPANSAPPAHATSHQARPAPADMLSNATRVMDALRARHAGEHGGDR